MVSTDCNAAKNALIQPAAHDTAANALALLTYLECTAYHLAEDEGGESSASTGLSLALRLAIDALEHAEKQREGSAQ